MLKIHNERTQCLNMSDEHMFLGHNPILNKDKNKKNIFKMIQRDIGLYRVYNEHNKRNSKWKRIMQEQVSCHKKFDLYMCNYKA